jgi:hypothetical protein
MVKEKGGGVGLLGWEEELGEEGVEVGHPSFCKFNGWQVEIEALVLAKCGFHASHHADMAVA